MSKKTEKKKAEKKKKDTAPEGKKRGGIHPPHPRCPSCSRAMYKSMEKGKPVKKSDPWAFCRNSECSLHGKDQSKDAIKKAAEESNEDEVEHEAEEEPSSGDHPNLDKKGDEAGSNGEEKKVKRSKIEADLSSGKYTHTEIANRCGCSTKTVRRMLASMREAGTI